MLNLIKKVQFISLAIPAASLVLASNFASAEIYKWSDARGVTQYSDQPPLTGLAKASQKDIINALQAKELCSVDANSKKTKSTTAFSANFFNAVFAKANNSNLGNNGIKLGVTQLNSTSNAVGMNAIRAVSSPKPVAAQYSALNATSAYNAGASKVTVFGNPTITAQNSPVSSTNTPPAAASQSASSASTPTSVASNSPAASAATSSSQAAAALNASKTANSPLVTPPPITSNGTNIKQVAQMPAVDINKNIVAAVGYDQVRIKAGPPPIIGDGNGQFRIDCGVSHMSNDDPMVYPNQQGAAHHHTFFGNTTINYKSNLMTIANSGTSTCRGGTANRSAYWVPSMIDTASNTPIKPSSALWYYKTGYRVAKELIVPPPKGLRIIAGNMKSTVSQRENAYINQVNYLCTMPYTKVNGHIVAWGKQVAGDSIPACSQGGTITTNVNFPQCWDGKNLDSPDHHSHMAYAISGKGCPEAFPVPIPSISLHTKYLVTSAQGTANWRLSSDNYPKNGQNAGYSGHADWVNGWDEKVMKGIVKNCLNAGKDCGNAHLGDGTIIY